MPATHLPRKAGRRERRRCHKVLRAARRADPTKRISMDYQQRYGTDYRKAREVVKSGELGAIKQIRAAWMGGGPAIAKGHAASEEKIRNWFFYRELSGDILIEQDCHNIDVVNWFMDTHPVKVTGYGSQGIASTATSMTTWRHLPVRRWYGLFLHANKFRTPGWSDVSETFIGEKGAVNVSRQGYPIYRAKGAPEVAKTSDDITLDNVNQFIEGARTGKLENAALWGGESTLVAVMALEAIVSGKEVTWDKVKLA